MSGFYGYCDITLLRWTLKNDHNYVFVVPKDFVTSVFFLAEKEPYALGAGIGLTMIFIVLTLFLLIHIKQISNNETTVEKERRKLSKTKIPNMYNKGFKQNWLECLLPKKPELRKSFFDKANN